MLCIRNAEFIGWELLMQMLVELDRALCLLVETSRRRCPYAQTVAGNPL
jgi:hypothetical protein